MASHAPTRCGSADFLSMDPGTELPTAAGADSNSTFMSCWCKQQSKKNVPRVWLSGNLGMWLLEILTRALIGLYLAVL